MLKKRLLALTFLIAWLAWWFWRPINLLPADLGRHLKNGEYILSNFETSKAVLTTNFYSFSVPYTPFVNHHWLSGVVFFLIYSVGGFKLLSLFYLVANLVVFLIFYSIPVRRGFFWTATLVAIVLIPILGSRTEIRPEIFSYLFFGITINILIMIHDRQLNPKYLWLLIPIQWLWINFHIYFFLGLIAQAVYFFIFALEKNPLKNKILKIALISCLASLVNPAFWRGLFYPLLIFFNYPIATYENQSIFVLQSYGLTNAIFFLTEITIAISIVLCFYLALFKSQLMRWGDYALLIIAAVLALVSVRNLSFYSLVAIANLPSAVDVAIPKLVIIKKIFVGAIIWLMVASLTLTPEALKQKKSFGLAPNNDGVANFINSNAITGPLFNDFDIGSYAIFFFFPRIKPFIDNRPEAYSTYFVQNNYKSIFKNEESWNVVFKKYNFNVILIHNDIHSQTHSLFIINRLHDPAWAPVYADNFAIVFLRRNAENAELIKKFEMDKSRFGIAPNTK